MRVVALEEHFTVPSAAGRISAEAKAKRGFRQRQVEPGGNNPLDLLPEFDVKRLKSMDENGITVQVLSQSGPGSDLVDGEEGVSIAKEFNDALAAQCQKHPTRFAGFAHLPLRSPEAAAKELERCVKDLGFVGALVNGTCQDKFMDDACYDSILSAAEQLDVPIYIHPSLAPEGVRNIYYSNLPGTAGTALETAGWGWHSEVAIHTLRMVLNGTLDKHRKLKIIIGHMGEMLPVMMARADIVSAPHVGHLQRSISQTILEQVWITTSGIFTQPPFIAALQTFGIDRIMFSVDYPYAPNAPGKRFLDQVALSPADKAKLAYGTADKLLKLKV